MPHGRSVVALPDGADAKGWYVSLSRAREAIHVYTSDKAALRQAVMYSGERKSVLKIVQASARAKYLRSGYHHFSYPRRLYSEETLAENIFKGPIPWQRRQKRPACWPPFWGDPDERDLDVDVAACRLGIGADAVGRIDQLRASSRLTPGMLTLRRARRKKHHCPMIRSIVGIDRRTGGQRYFLSGSGQLDCTDKAGRPSGGEKLFRGGVRLGQLDVETTVVKHRNRRETPRANTTIVHF